MNGMSMKTQLEIELRNAMRASDDLRKSTLRMVLSEIRLVEVEKGSLLDDASIMTVLHKEVKSRRESIADAQRANRPDLIDQAEAEIVILEGYLPKGFSAEELETLARQAITETSASSLKEMGQVMKVLMPRLQGRATGDQASQVVRKLLG
jgi:uncharacterized protein YqeY